MEELIKQVSERAGVSEEIAQKTVEVVVELLKDKLPAPVAGQIEGLLSGESGAGGLMKGIGGLLGR